MSGVMERTLSILEFLGKHPEGVQVSAIASELDMPASAAHRLLKELSQYGYVRQLRTQGDYALTIKLAGIGLAFLARTGVPDIAQPILDRLAADSRELVRLSVIDGEDLVWVGVAQGAVAGLRYDPGREQGIKVHLAGSAGGHAWLSTLTDEQALEKIGAQGLRADFAMGPGAPTSIPEVLASLADTRKRGYATMSDSYHAGMAAMAVPIFRSEDHAVIGCLSIAGPGVRVTPELMDQFHPLLREAADEIGGASEASFFFNRNRALPAETETRQAG
ncbi:transcriptional regulator, IclR family [Celeribacter baekdonensis]|uniref:Transcriptional regulator, IclR family n=1 Tax=Celeribacter baekdonensis TaxID=875171 RepID=A0A1G7SFL0_9RHOB|nr:IclR family transcriptional regulator [Celeribacter baekdonensis]SDG21855.1 transcriptional regulator, IclR family [Celeribacter baekdonensis]